MGQPVEMLSCFVLNWDLDAGDFRPLTNRFGRSHRVEDTGDHLTGARAIHIVGGLGFEELCVRQDDSELVIQAMEQDPKL